jgi:hypothetical protein
MIEEKKKLAEITMPDWEYATINNRKTGRTQGYCY